MRYMFRKWLPDKSIQEEYVSAGCMLGSALTIIIDGKVDGFEKKFYNWARWEQEYSGRGYRTLSIAEFIDLDRGNRDIKRLIGVKRNLNEKPVLHSEKYTKTKVGKVEPALSLEHIANS